MNLDDQLILGIVFIIAGVAMGLLAYAAFLNRRENAEEEEPVADEGAADPLSEEETLAAEAGASEATEEGSAEAQAVQPDAPTVAVEAQEGPEEAPTQATSPPEEEIADVSAAPTAGAAETRRAVEPEVASEAQPAAPPSALLRRDPVTGRLLVEIGEETYRTIEELRDSDDWERVDDLFSDVLAWLVKQEPQAEQVAVGEEDSSLDRPVSMIQEINEIIKEKLAEREGGPKAVRLMESTDGSVRVYIGVDSYEMDEVPDEEAQAIIQQAVREWEARQ